MMIMKLNKKLGQIAVCAMGVALLAACSAPAPAPANGTPIAAATTNAVTSPLTSPVPTPMIPPTKVAGTGMVSGKLLEASKPAVGRILYLATLTKDAAGNETSARLDRTSAIRAISDYSGNFTFYNVPPGRYAIIVDTVRDAYLLRKPANDGDLIFEVTADNTNDLGSLNYDVLPR